jgi:hypothetical protein
MRKIGWSGPKNSCNRLPAKSVIEILCLYGDPKRIHRTFKKEPHGPRRRESILMSGADWSLQLVNGEKCVNNDFRR